MMLLSFARTMVFGFVFEGFGDTGGFDLGVAGSSMAEPAFCGRRAGGVWPLRDERDVVGELALPFLATILRTAALLGLLAATAVVFAETGFFGVNSRVDLAGLRADFAAGRTGADTGALLAPRGGFRFVVFDIRRSPAFVQAIAAPLRTHLSNLRARI